MSNEILPSVLKTISNRIRRNIITSLTDGRKTYLELLISCSLSPKRHCGWFDYHLRILLDDGFLTKEQNQYLLTNFGRDVSSLLKIIERESYGLFKKEVKPMSKKERITFSWKMAENITDKLKVDSRVDGVWVSGSLARDEADEFSDLDMKALIDESKYVEFMNESREDKWSSLDSEGWSDEWGDKYVTKKHTLVEDLCFSVDYLTLEKIFNCDWDELEHIDRILGGLVHSRIMYDPKKIVEKLKKEFSIYPEKLRKRRIIKLDDDAAMFDYLAECEIRRNNYIGAAYYLRKSINLQAHLLYPLNEQYFLTNKNLLERLTQLDKVPKAFTELYMSILFDLKPNEKSMKRARASNIDMLVLLRKQFDYMKYRKEFPVWDTKRP